eukprot:7382086-Prymnesium_polylepis.1
MPRHAPLRVGWVVSQSVGAGSECQYWLVAGRVVNSVNSELSGGYGYGCQNQEQTSVAGTSTVLLACPRDYRRGPAAP